MTPALEQLTMHAIVGDPVAEIRTTAEELSARLGLAWAEGEDDLGPLRHAAVRLSDGTEALLVARDDGDEARVTVVMRDAAREQAAAVLSALGAGDDDLVAAHALAPSGGEDVADLQSRVAGLEAALSTLTRSLETVVRANHLGAQGFQTAYTLLDRPEAGSEAGEDPADATGIASLSQARARRRAAG